MMRYLADAIGSLSVDDVHYIMAMHSWMQLSQEASSTTGGTSSAAPTSWHLAKKEPLSSMIGRIF